MDEKRGVIISKLTGILLDAMSKKTISYDQATEIATYILNQSKVVNDEKSADEFLKQLSEKYLIFKSYYVNRLLERQIEQTDVEKINSIKDQLVKLANFKTK